MQVNDMTQPGALVRNTSGRYELNGDELTSGSLIDVQRGDRWEAGRVEFDPDAQDYVIILSLGGTLLITSSLSVRQHL